MARGEMNFSSAKCRLIFIWEGGGNELLTLLTSVNSNLWEWHLHGRLHGRWWLPIVIQGKAREEKIERKKRQRNGHRKCITVEKLNIKQSVWHYLDWCTVSYHWHAKQLHLLISKAIFCCKRQKKKNFSHDFVFHNSSDRKKMATLNTNPSRNAKILNVQVLT